MSVPQIGGVVVSPQKEVASEQPVLTEIDVNQSRLKRSLNVAKRAIQTSVIAIEVLPINESIRFGAYAAAMTQTQNPLVGAAVLGGTTLMVEGAGALAAASVLDTKQSDKGIEYINKRIKKIAPNGVNMTPPIEAGAAMVGGSAVVLALKQIEDPSRTLSQNRKHGMFTAGWMSAYFAAEGALFAESIDDFRDPKMVGASILALGGLIAIARKAKKQFKKQAESKDSPESLSIEAFTNRYQTVEVVKNVSLDEETISRSVTFNNSYRNASDEAVKIGLYGEDIEAAISNPESFLVQYESTDDTESVYAPLLVPVESLEWYNTQLLKERYGTNDKIYYFAHPSVLETETEKAKITNVINTVLESGAKIIYDFYPSQQSIVQQLGLENGFKTENLGRGLAAGEAEVFSGVLKVGEEKHIAKSPTLSEIYEQGVKNGEFKHDTQNGVTLETVISDKEIEKVWKIYEKPFERLSKDDAMHAGFDKDTLLGMLKDQDIVKILNRSKGEITTLLFFTNDFKFCPWFNAEYYKKNYPEYYETDNIFMFPGIVTGDSIKGQSYSLKLIDLAVKIAAKRGTDALVTFECSSVSKMYIPRIVRRAINRSGAGTTDDFTKSISSMGYKVLSKDK